MKILVTGGLGYIGSHTVVELLNNNHSVVIVDNLINSKIEVLDNLKIITKKEIDFYQIDILNFIELEKIFKKYKFDAIIHFAGLKAVGESCDKPLLYYENNVSGSINLYNLAIKHNVKNIVFSSSATVYGDDFKVPFKEEYGLGTCTNPYGETKKINEIILTDLSKTDKDLSVVLLRYFNPVGASKTQLLGENPNGIPNNLVPYIAKVAIKELPYLNVYGNDYNTPDGTAIRDYIHIIDLAKGHLKAVEYAVKNKGIEVINLGTGKGTSVLEMVKAYEKASNIKIDYKIQPRRKGDIETCFADTAKAKKLLNFETEYDIEEMCLDSYNYMIKNIK